MLWILIDFGVQISAQMGIKDFIKGSPELKHRSRLQESGEYGTQRMVAALEPRCC